MTYKRRKCLKTNRTKNECQNEGFEQFSLGIYAGYWCELCWAESGYREEGPSGFDPMDAGESYDEDY
jgi:hypothetical protein